MDNSLNMTFDTYLEKSNIGYLRDQTQNILLNEYVDTYKNTCPQKFKVYEADELYIYPVPLYNEMNYTPLYQIKAKPKPFNLAIDAMNRFQNPTNLMCSTSLSRDYRSHPMTKRLFKLKEILKHIYQDYQLDWIGLYRIMSNVDHVEKGLVKEVYIGEMSRSVYPLTTDYISKSTLTYTGMIGQAFYLDDIQDPTRQYSILPSIPTASGSIGFFNKAVGRIYLQIWGEIDMKKLIMFSSTH